MTIAILLRMSKDLRDRMGRAFHLSKDKSVSQYIRGAIEQRIKREEKK